MKIITLWQPWATLIALGIKKFETRSWSTRYRGKLAIHAAKRKVNKNALEKIAFDLSGQLDYLDIQSNDYPQGVIIAVCEVISCSFMVDRETLYQLYNKVKINERDANSYPLTYLVQHAQKKDCIWIDEVSIVEKSVGDWRPGRYAWQLDRVQQLDKMISYKGGQGLRELDEETSKILTRHCVAWVGKCKM